jgi:hypothetical protein
MDEKEYKLDDLNEEIKTRYDKSEKYDKQLDDSHLLDKFMESKSTKNKIKKIRKVLIGLFRKYNIEEKIEQNDDELIITINGYQLLLKDTLKLLSQFIIEPGTKGGIRGNKFNSIVYEYIKKQILKYEHLKLEKEIEIPYLNEKVDWLLTNTITDKRLVGYNQLTLWGGGQQSNRAGHYIIDNTLQKKCEENNSLLICVIARYPDILKSKTKVYKLFSTGFKNKTLYYLNDLKKVIVELA